MKGGIMTFFIEIKDPTGKTSKMDQEFRTRREATNHMRRSFSGAGWILALTSDCFEDGYDFELLTGIGQESLIHTGWYLRVRDL